MHVLEQAAVPLDFVRGRALRSLSSSALLARVLGRRDTRIAALGTAQVALLFVVAARWPVALYFLGPVLLGVPHLAADIRYLVFRVTPPRPLLLGSLVLASLLTLVRLCVGLGVASATLGARVDLVVGVVWVGLALAGRPAMSPAARTLLAAVSAAVIAGMLRHAETVDLAITHGHNVAAVVLWLALFRRRGREGWAPLPLVFVVVACAVLMSGAVVPWAARHGGLVAFGQRASHLGAGLAPGVSIRFGTAIAMTFVFLQSVHYAVWTGWIPQDCLPGEGTPTFRMTVRSLERDFGRAGLIAVVTLTIGFAIVSCVHLRQSVGWYMALARAHVWLELAVFGHFVGRRPVARLDAARDGKGGADVGERRAA
jgi:hypothetical protein